jgi:uncharacterized RDD family membrane protein YckC
VDIAYPALFRRYLSTLLDGLLLLLAIVVISKLLGNRPSLTGLRVVLFLFVVLGYEPLLTTYACTVGQYLMGIRVRRAADPTQHLSVFAAYVRYLVKIPLGMLSFMTIGFTSQRRAIHDFAARSIMIFASRPAAAGEVGASAA